jgi:hypothetical protein
MTRLAAQVEMRWLHIFALSLVLLLLLLYEASDL